MTPVAGTSTRPALDWHPANGVDHSRLQRSLTLRGERVGHGRYRFTGGQEPHWVDLYTTAFPRCDCADHLWRDSVCKHILAALIREGDEMILREVGRLFEGLRPAA